jgi:O-antigen ligase
MDNLRKIIDGLVYLFVFLLPWQTVWIVEERFLGGAKWQAGTVAIYGTEILLWLIIILSLVVWAKEKNNKMSFDSFRSSITNHYLPVTGYSLLISIFLLCSLLSIFWSGDKQLALYWWIKLAEGIVLFFVVSFGRLRVRKICWPLALSGAVQGVLAIWQFLVQEVAPNKWLGLAAHLPAELGTAVVATSDGRWLRAYGAFSHPNILGGFLAISFFATLFLYLNYRPGGRKIILASSLLAISGGLFFSFSRSAWLAAVTAYGVWPMAYGLWRMAYGVWPIANSKWQMAGNKKFLEIIKPTLYLLFVFLVLFSIYRPLVAARVVSSDRLEIKSVQERLDSVANAEQMVKSHWLAGVGIGNYTFSLHQKNPGLPAFAYLPAHNLYLLIAAELGLVGSLIFLAIIASFFLSAWRRSPREFWPAIFLAIILILGCFDHYFWTSYSGLMLWWLTAALIVKKEPDSGS